MAEDPAVPSCRPQRPLWQHAGSLLILLAALLPALPWLCDLPRFGALQYNDYYGNVAQVLDGNHFTADPLRWLAIKSNEHTVTLPTLLYAVNYGLTGGDNRGLSFVSILLGIGCALVAGSMLARAARCGWAGQALGTLAAGALWFTPAVAHSYVMGFSGSIWILANLLAVLAMWAQLRVAREDRVLWTVPVVLVGWLGAITYTTNMSLWPALLLGAIVAGLGRGKVTVLAVGAAVVYLMQWWMRTRPPNHPRPNFEVTSLLQFLGAYLGWPLTGDVGSGQYVGLAALAFAIAGIAIALGWRDRAAARSAAPGVMLVVYGVANALGTGVGRSAAGVEAAHASRYVSLAMSFWIGILALGLWLGQLPWPRRARPAVVGSAPNWQPRLVVAAVAVMLAASTWASGGSMRERYLDRASWHPVAAIAVRHGVLTDTDVLATANDAPEQFAFVPWLETMCHVPFETPRPTRRRVQVDPTLLAADTDPRIVGQFDLMLPMGDSVARAQGWAAATTGTIGELLLLDEQGWVRGELAQGTPRPDVAAVHGASHRYAGIAGYAFDVGSHERLRIYVRLVGEQTYSPLPGEQAGSSLASK